MNKRNQDVAAAEEGRNNSLQFDGKKEKVFLIGDSIRVGYCPYVEEHLGVNFEVVYPDENCRSTQYVLTSIRGWANMFDNPDNVKIVTFNCGHWDIAHWNRMDGPLTDEAEYERNIGRIITQLRAFFPIAKIVFFTTSPVNNITLKDMLNPRTNEEINHYNEIAVRVCKSREVFVGDMNAFICEFGEDCFVDYTHLKKEYSKKVAKFVADKIREIL